MYIEKICLNDVRCFEVAELDLSECELGTSILIAGNNGFGKSTILRAIAMGLCDRDSAASLHHELEGNFARQQTKDNKLAVTNNKISGIAKIEITLLDENHDSWEICTEVIEWKGQTIVTVEQKYKYKGEVIKFDLFSSFWNKLFLVSYGAGVRTIGTAKYSEYFAPDAVYSLFKYDSHLQDPELAWRRLLDASRNESNVEGSTREEEKVNRYIQKLLKNILDLELNKEVYLKPNGIYVQKEEASSIPLDAMGDGHRSLVKLTLDILVWALLKQNLDELDLGENRDWTPITVNDEGGFNIQGIVIIDEIEQHLHPKLQRNILKGLAEKFPQIQFIMTTHSPLCVSGTADAKKFDKESYKVFSLERGDDEWIDVIPMPIPYGLRADQIMIEYFQLDTTLNLSAEHNLARVRELVNLPEKDRSSEENNEIASLLKEIEKYSFSLAESLRDREIQKEALDYLKERKNK